MPAPKREDSWEYQLAKQITDRIYEEVKNGKYNENDVIDEIESILIENQETC
jgi:predicted transcriptional regulator